MRFDEVVGLAESLVGEPAHRLQRLRRLCSARAHEHLVAAADSEPADGGEAARVRRPAAPRGHGERDAGVQRSEGAHEQRRRARVQPEAIAHSHVRGRRRAL